MDTSGNAEPAGAEPPPTARRKLGALGWAFAVAVVTAVGAGGVSWLGSVVNTHSVVVETDVDVIGSRNFSGGEYLFDRPIQDVGPPPGGTNSCDGRYAWADGLGAVNASTTNFRVTVTAAEGHAVQVVGARAVPLDGQPESPLLGAVATCPGRGAEPVDLLQFDLDTGQYVYYDGTNPAGSDLNIAVPAGETAVLDVTAGTDDRSWVYDVHLILRVDGREVVEILDNDDRHFRTSSPLNAKRYQWIDGRWEDIDTGGGPPPVDLPIAVPPACSLLATSDLDGVMGGRFTQRNDIAPSAGPSGSGLDVVSTFCSWYDEAGDSVQTSLRDSPTPEAARTEFEFTVGVLEGQGATAQQVPGYVDVQLLSDGSVVALRDTRVVMLSIVRQDNRTTPFDPERLTTLLDEALSNLPTR